MTFQTDWRQAFGGDNPRHVTKLSRRFLMPLGGALRRYPLGRKGYNGRVDHQPPLAVLQRLGYTGDARIALFPSVLPDAIRNELLLACCPEAGNDLLAHYIFHPPFPVFESAQAGCPAGHYGLRKLCFHNPWQQSGRHGAA